MTCLHFPYPLEHQGDFPPGKIVCICRHSLYNLYFFSGEYDLRCNVSADLLVIDHDIDFGLFCKDVISLVTPSIDEGFFMIS